MTSTHVRRAAASALAVVSSACGVASREVVPARTPPATSEQPSAAAIAKARADSTRLPWTAADVRFMSAMIGHHAQAIVMARLAPTHGASAQVLTLAERIISAQQDDIATMRRWLGDRGQTVPESHASHTTASNGDAHEMPMSGMLSDAQMRQLDEARGSAFDQLFLSSMIQHHRGAVSMVKSLFSSYGAAQDETVFKFASDVNVDQTTEIARMQRMLVSLMVEKRSP